MARYMSQPSALTWVLKGLAVPPPYCGWMTGVLNSRKPRAFRNARIAATIRLIVREPFVRRSGSRVVSR